MNNKLMINDLLIEHSDDGTLTLSTSEIEIILIEGGAERFAEEVENFVIGVPVDPWVLPNHVLIEEYGPMLMILGESLTHDQSKMVLDFLLTYYHEYLNGGSLFEEQEMRENYLRILQ